jgi:hypothetical protein
MPIRINLLAEQQADEEMRRKDPVKRVIFAGVGLVVVMLLWIGLTEVRVLNTQRELSHYEQQVKAVDEQSKLVKSNQAVVMDMESKLTALDTYAQHRFLWGSFLDALQKVSLQNIRLVELRADHQYLKGGVNKFASTNIVITLPEAPSAWKFWASKPKVKPISDLVAEALVNVTNKPPFTTNQLHYRFKTTPVATSALENKVTQKVEFTNPEWASEAIKVEVKGRDYSTPSGSAIDTFARQIGSNDYFKNFLAADGFRFTERPPQARTDLADPVNPNSPFVPFTIQLNSKERVFGNE